MVQFWRTPSEKFSSHSWKSSDSAGLSKFYERGSSSKLLLKRSLKLCDSVTVVIHANRLNCINFPIFCAIQAGFLNASFNDWRILVVLKLYSPKKWIFRILQKSVRTLVLIRKFRSPTHFVGRDWPKCRISYARKIPRKKENFKILFSSETASKINFSL